MENKPTLLYASPFPPQGSGISDYSVVLVKALQRKFDITLYIDDYEISEKSLSDFPVLRYGRDEIDFSKFDYKIYNMGNNPGFHQYIYEAALEHPGMVILHDLVLYYLFVGYYQNRGSLYSSVYSKLGTEYFKAVKKAVKERGSDLLAQKDLASKMPMNEELFRSGNKIMVHSEYSREKILSTKLLDESMVRKINMIEQKEENAVLLEKGKLFEKYGVPSDALIVSSFGYIAETKLNLQVCRAVKSVAKKTSKKICYVMVGAGEYADAELSDGIIIKTGFTELDEFNSFVEYSDIVANLRNPTMGETSAAMIRILQTGKPCITNNGGWFSEIPDDVVCKVSLDGVQENIEKTLLRLIEDEKLRNDIGRKAKEYIEKEFSKEAISQEIYKFLFEPQKNVKIK